MTGRALQTSFAAAALAAAALGCGGGSPASSDDGGSGCMPLDAPTTCPSTPPSYKNEISFIVATHCAEANCHSPGGASGHDFTTYEGVFGDHVTFAYELSSCMMPPAGYPQPTSAQRLSLITWADTCRAPNN